MRWINAKQREKKLFTDGRKENTILKSYESFLVRNKNIESTIFINSKQMLHSYAQWKKFRCP